MRGARDSASYPRQPPPRISLQSRAVFYLFKLYFYPVRKTTLPGLAPRGVGPVRGRSAPAVRNEPTAGKISAARFPGCYRVWSVDRSDDFGAVPVEKSGRRGGGKGGSIYVPPPIAPPSTFREGNRREGPSTSFRLIPGRPTLRSAPRLFAVFAPRFAPVRVCSQFRPLPVSLSPGSSSALRRAPTASAGSPFLLVPRFAACR